MPVSTECAAALLSFRYPSKVEVSYDLDLWYSGKFWIQDVVLLMKI